MIKSTTKTNTKFVLKAVFDEKGLNANVVKKVNHITELPSKKQAFIFLGKKTAYKVAGAKAAAKAIVANNVRGYQVEVESFVAGKVTSFDVISALVETHEYANAKIYNAKTAKKDKVEDLLLVGLTPVAKKEFKEAMIIADAQTYTRNFGAMAPNLLTSETYAKQLKADFTKLGGATVKVLGRKEAKAMKMGLFLSVNLGSAYEPKIVVIEYKGDAKSKEKTVMVGKGITFDAGGYNIKTGPHMANMKFDMLGSATVAGVMKAIVQLKPKTNVSAVLMLTDNMINSVASKPDDVYIAMNGKSVEINNTDAEGRLVMADGLTYAAQKLKATRLIDAATLTGAMVAAMGHTYTGVWATADKDWKAFEKAAEVTGEGFWRMPFHADFLKYMKGSKVADLKNTALDGLGGANTAAMFLKEFTEKVPYVHLDIAGTGDINGVATGLNVKTLVEVFR